MAVKKIEQRDVAFNGAIGRFLGEKMMELSEFAGRIGVERETLWRWRKNPSVVTLGKLRVLVRAAQMSDEEILMIVRGART